MRTPPDISPPGAIDFLVLFGSHAHGTSTPESDEDWRGVFRTPTNRLLGLYPPPTTWQAKPDVVAWELGHFCRLLLKGNPNIVGMLSTPEDCVLTESPVISALRAGRSRFVTRAMASAYLGWIETELRHPDLPPKRLSHLVRLTWELKDAVYSGEVMPRLHGRSLEFVMSVKRGEVERPEVEAIVRPHLEPLWERAHRLPEPPTAWVEEVLLAARHSETWA